MSKPVDALPPIPFGRILRIGSRGNDVQGVKRSLARAGHGKLGRADRIYGPGAKRNVTAFQRGHTGLVADGVYGPKTHAALEPWFDEYAFLLYTGKQPHPIPVVVNLPETFTPTHLTAGLEGYPAIDVFGPPGASVGAPAAGRVRRLSGHDPAQGGVPGGAYGRSLYLESVNGDYFLTHFATVDVPLGASVKHGDRIGTICDASVAHMASSLSHIHEGFRPAV